MTLQQLQDFVAVVTHGGFRTAALALGVSQGGLSKSIANLEQTHEVRFIERHAEGLALTAEGEEFLPRARAILLEANRTDMWLKATRDRKASRVSLGMSIEPSMRLVPTVLTHFRGSYPQVTVQIIQSLGTDLVNALQENLIEFAVMAIAEGSTSPAFTFDVLYEVEPAVVARRGHPCADVRKLEEIAHCDWVGISGYGQDDFGIRELYATYGLEAPLVAVVSNSVFATIPILLASDSVARLPSTLVSHAALGQQLVCIPIHEPRRRRQIAIVRKSTRKLSREASTLVAMLSSYARLLYRSL